MKFIFTDAARESFERNGVKNLLIYTRRTGG